MTYPVTQPVGYRLRQENRVSRATVTTTRPRRTEFRLLSAHEHRIATMIAGGQSNQTVGDGLGVSTRAVEHHLTRVYRKLGIRGRAQLPAALADTSARVNDPRVNESGILRR